MFWLPLAGARLGSQRFYSLDEHQAMSTVSSQWSFWGCEMAGQRSLSRKMSHFTKPLWLELLPCTESIFVGSGKPSLDDSSFGNYLTIARAWQPLPLRKELFAG